MFIGINMGIVGSLMGGASILALFAAGEVGLWFDTTDITTLYQDVNALTQVTAPGQTCALMLDKSKGLVPGPELVTGPWTLSTAGGTSTATENPSGTLNLTGDGTNQARADYSFASALGKTYRMTCTVSGAIASTVVGPSQGSNLIVNSIALALGVNSYVFTATTATTWFRFFKSAATLSVISNISIKELPGYHAVQTTAAQRPTYGVMPFGGIRNLANGSGAVGDVAYWPASFVQNGITHTKVASGTDTDGLPYVDYSVVGTASATAFFDFYTPSNSRFPTVLGQTFNTSFVSKLISGSVPPALCGVVSGVIGETAPATAVESFTTTPAVPTVDTAVSQSGTFANAATNQARCAAYIRTASGAVVNYTIRIKGLQFEKAAARSAFQLSLSKYNVTEAGKAPLGVLYPDGIDDGMVTPSINFSGTDKVTLWAGLQKMSDAAQALLAELSVSTGGNPNTFGLQAATPNPATFRFVSAGSATGSGIAEIAGYPATTVAVITGIGDISAPKASIIVNNSATVTSAVSQGTGNYSNNPIYLFRRGGASLPFNGIFTGLIVRGAASSAAQISNANAFLNSELGAY